MNKLLKVKERASGEVVINKKLDANLMDKKDYWVTNDILPLLIQNKDINPFKYLELEKLKVDLTKPGNDAIEKLAKKLEELINERKCKLEGVCEIRNELYMETFNELIRHITIDCPERGILLANIRDEIQYTLSAFEELYDNELGFNSRRQVMADKDVDELLKRKNELQFKLNNFRNKKINFIKELENLDRKHAEVEEKLNKENQQEIEFLEHQNKILANFLEHVKSIKDPLEIKNNLESNK